MESNKGRKKKDIGFDSPFATRLRKLLAETNTTQPMLAAAVGVSRQAVGQWKDGNTVPDILDCQKIADYFKVPIDYLLGRTEVRSLEIDIRAASEFTCLSEQCLNILKTAQGDYDSKSLCKLTSAFVVELFQNNYFLNKIISIYDINVPNIDADISEIEFNELFDTANRSGYILLGHDEAIEYHRTRLKNLVCSAAEKAFQEMFDEMLRGEVVINWKNQ